MNNIEIFKSEKFGEIRIVIINGEPWFVAKDVADILGYSETEKMARRLDDDEKLTSHFGGSGQNREMIIISESGLYNAIIGNRTKTSEFKQSFMDWIRSLGYIETVSLKSRNEIEFADALDKMLVYFDYTIERQYRVGKYAIDMYIPEINCAIEYDEKHHDRQVVKDVEREDEIKKEIGCSFIRVDDSFEIYYNLSKVISIIATLKAGDEK